MAHAKGKSFIAQLMAAMHKEPEHENLMTLTLEDDSVIQLQPLVTIGYLDKEYLALTPAGEESEDVYFYEFIEHGENEIELRNIEDEEILEIVLNEFEKWFDEQWEAEESADTE
jgi:hypothetical protein